MRVSSISDVPNAPDYVRGLITVRVRIMPAFDLRRLLGIETEDDNGENERILIVETGEMILGMLVDRMKEVARYPKEIVQVPPDSSNTSELKGIVKVDKENRLIMILDQNELVSTEDNDSLIEWMNEEGIEGVPMNENDNASGTDNVSEDYVQVVSFNLGDEEYGIEITQIQEINRLGSITSMPKAPAFIEGVTNLRGEVIPVIDTRKRFGLPEKTNDDRTRIIIVDMAGRKTGLITDRVNEVMRIPKDDITPPPPVISAREEARFFSGIGRLDNGKRIVLLLDVEKILRPDEQAELRQIPSDEMKEKKTSKKTTRKTSAKRKARTPKKKSKSSTDRKETLEIEE
jgi:purine-binding chemotaxis protein CheW